MKRYWIVLWLVHATTAAAWELDLQGFLAVETRCFFAGATEPGASRARCQPAAAVAPRWSVASDDGSWRFDVEPLLRWDAVDSERSRVDLREASFWRRGERFDLRMGVGQLFWGVTESRHLVDVVNQSDPAASPDGESKLGQPMVEAAVPLAGGRLDLYLLPGARRRPYPGRRGRLRGAFTVDSDGAVYTGGAGPHDVGAALRWQRSVGVWDLGLSAFRGTSREPRLVADPRRRLLVPAYDRVEQWGLDVQATLGATLYKLEAIRRAGHPGGPFGAWVAGLEHTLYGVVGAADLGLLVELHRDHRPAGAPTTFYDRDVFAGFRLTANDVAATTFLAGALLDSRLGSVLVTLEGGRRLGRRHRLEVEARWLDAPAEDTVLGAVSRDDHLVVRWVRYF